MTHFNDKLMIVLSENMKGNGKQPMKKMILLAGGMVNDEEAWVEYDKDGNETYYYRSDTHTVNDDEEAEYPDDSILNDLFEQFFNAEVIEFSKV